MKKLFLFAAAGLFFAVTGNAQVKRNAPQTQKVQSNSSHHRKGEMMNGMNLTPDQKTQMKALHESNKQQRDAIKDDATLTHEQRKEKMKDLHQSQSERMNSILTPEQQGKRKAFMENRKKNGKMNGKRHDKKGHHKAEAAIEKS